MTFAETAYAKVNLALHVRRRRDDGYHDIETLFAFADFGDELTAIASENTSLSITGPFADGLSSGPDNLVLRAADALARSFGVQSGAALSLAKLLPVASGIGGGSADAAATLRLLNRLWGINAPDAVLAKIGLGLGADVPACVFSRTARGEGVGEVLRFEDEAGVQGTPILLVNPGVGVATGQVFAGWDGCDRGALPELPPLAAASASRNDLTQPAIEVCPQIGDVLRVLAAEQGAGMVRMSGSGATCFALFESNVAAAAARHAVAAAHPAWWLASGELR